MGGVNKGGTGLPQGQTTTATPTMGAPPPPPGTAPPIPRTAPPSMADRQAMMAQYRQKFPSMGGGIGSLAGMNRSNFMPGGALAAPLDLANASQNPNLGGTAPSSAGMRVSPQMAMEAMNRMRSQAGSQAGRPAWAGQGGRFGGMGAPVVAPAASGQMNNGGIVGLAGGGSLGEPVSRGGVSYAPALSNPRPAIAAAPITSAAPATAAPKVSWAPVATTGTGSSMFTGIAPAPITAPAKWSGPTTPQEIWQPPAEVAVAETAGMDPATYNSLKMAAMLGIPVEGDVTSGMSDKQYIDYKLMTQSKGSGGSGGSGNRR